MRNVELIYYAMLRAERRLETEMEGLPNPGSQRALNLAAASIAVAAIREEIGETLSKDLPF